MYIFIKHNYNNIIILNRYHNYRIHIYIINTKKKEEEERRRNGGGESTIFNYTVHIVVFIINTTV